MTRIAFRKKVYGQSKVDRCPFCNRQAVVSNSQDVPTCTEHRDCLIMNFKCACGDWLDLMKGKYGPYFNCLNCGNVSWAKGIELNHNQLNNPEKEEKKDTKKNRDDFKRKFFGNKKEFPSPGEKKEIVVTSDEVDFLYS